MSTNDPVLRLAHQRVISASAELEVQIAARDGSAPTIAILQKLRENAADSLNKLAFADLSTRKGVEEARAMQNEVKRYDEWLAWMKEFVNEGIALDEQMKEEERDELLDYLVQTEEGRQEALALGIVAEAPRD